MDTEKNNIFNCDILICGTSLLNTLLSVYFSIKNYKVINIDKNSYYGDVNCSLNFNQFEDEKKNLENFYEEFIPFSSLDKRKKKLLKEIIVNYFQLNNNKFNIDLNPKIIYNESNIVNLLVILNAHIYISFIGIQNFYLTYKKSNKIEKIIKNVEEKDNVNDKLFTLGKIKNSVMNEKEDKNKKSNEVITMNKNEIISKNEGEKEMKKINNIVSKDIDSICTKSNEDKDDLIILKIPLNKSQVFLDPNLNLNEKRMIMNFIYKNIDYDKNYSFSNFSNHSFLKKSNTTQKEIFKNNEYSINEVKNNSIDNEKQKNINGENINILEYLRTYNINDKITDYIVYGIGLFDLQLKYSKNMNISKYYLSGYTKEKIYVMNKKEFLQRLHILINSLNKFKLQNLFENAFIYPCYGLNDIIYALSRVSCLNNCIYMINRKIQNILYDDFYINKKKKKKDNTLQIKEVILDNGYKIRAKFFISSGSNMNFNEMKKHVLKKKNKKNSKQKKTHIRTNRLIVISTYSLIGKSGLSFYIHKQKKPEEKEMKDDNSYICVHILQLDYNSGSCPVGFFLTYFTYLEIEEEEKITYDDSNIYKNQENENKINNSKFQKPSNFLLLLDVLILFINKYKNNNKCIDLCLPIKDVYNEKLLEKIKIFLNDKESKKEQELDLNNEIKNENNNISNEVKDIKIENNDEKNEINKMKKDFFINSFNDILRNEGIIYYAYYEYKPIIYRKDTIKIINENIDYYKSIFENIQNEKEKGNENEEMKEKEMEKDEINDSNSDEINDSKFNEINQKNKDGYKNYEFNQINNYYNKNEIIELKENKNICNLLFTNDIHNYPIYPMIEDVSMFFYIISKIHKSIEKNQNETIYDTFNDMKTFFNYQPI
ncbi:GDP dissociation inhibitor, putative [Plasmodium relictum]|uniref:GDP dissociation inhibitor, putative n=1 Tax=Plasmodium relictum TaxID=85471 RepID=A0A1J1H3A6_PLARL|nr:GDP dissociation inhibitor, putative [Plasmodium relictum]CRG99232.1 GDP dissociation inhibitor, putative [Plasmodium relictum]